MMQRRQFLRLTAGAVGLPMASQRAWAQTYPTRPVHLIVGAPPGGVTDVFARLVGQWLSERLGQQFVIENRPGAGTNIGTEAVVRSSADGYTLLMASVSNAYNATLYENLTFDFIRDIAPVAGVMRGTGVLVVHPSVPVRTVPEFIEYAKAHPGKLNMASGGIGTGQHLYGELFKSMTGVDMLHVPYRGGGPALSDLLAGHVQVMFDTISTSIEHIRSGRLPVLAVTAGYRWDLLPGVPSIAEFVPGYEATGWLGVGAPKNTPVEIIRKLNDEINMGLADPKVKTMIANLAAIPLPMTPAELGAHIAAETEKWGKVIRAANIKM